MRSCPRDRGVVHNNVLYSDDNNGHVPAPYGEDNEYGYVVEGLRVLGDIGNQDGRSAATPRGKSTGVTWADRVCWGWRVAPSGIPT